ncbi:MAG TPA: serine/threonine-protein kinase [Pseudonocardiaceae bacterium]|nr:serine/threonine-protein kinase [Pseudonocardiaceae bacterium]
MLTSGQLLADRYRLDRRIAVGGMGEVWDAADTRLDRRVAVKVLKPELCGDAEFLHRFRTEARTTASLNHPGIAAVHDYGETAALPDGPHDTAYLVMELVEGEPLAAILAKHHRLSAEQTLDIMEQAGLALQAAHERGYVHRDVKPGNIMIGPTGAVKLTDFGIAKAADAAPVTRSGMVMGTAHYIAPEQALGDEASPSSDVYSLAVVGYECLVGHRPFLSENAVTVAMMHIRDLPPPLPPDVPPAVRGLIEATLVKDPRQRYVSGGEFAAAAAAVRAGAPLPTPSGLLAQQQAVQQAQQQAAQQQLLMQQQLPVGVPGGPPTMPPSAPVPPPMGASGPQPGLSYPLPNRPPRHNAVWVLLGLLLLVLVGLGVWAITEAVNRGGPTPPGGSGATGASGQPVSTTAQRGGPQGLLGGAQPAQLRINQSDYLGRPADLVAAELHRDGLDTTVITEGGATPANPASCTVGSVTPNGAVPIGTVVTITCRTQGAAG